MLEINWQARGKGMRVNGYAGEVHEEKQTQEHRKMEKAGGNGTKLWSTGRKWSHIKQNDIQLGESQYNYMMHSM